MFHASGSPKKAEVPIIISDKIVFNQKQEQGQRKPSYNDKEVNSSRSYDNHK